MKSVFLVVAFFLFSHGSLAQKPQQSFELEDGSAVVEEILKKYDDGSVKIDAAFGIIILSADNIAAIKDSISSPTIVTADVIVPIQYQPMLQNTQDVELR